MSPQQRKRIEPFASLLLRPVEQRRGFSQGRGPWARLCAPPSTPSSVEEAQAWERYYDAKTGLEKAQLNLLRRTGDLAAALR